MGMSSGHASISTLYVWVSRARSQLASRDICWVRTRCGGASNFRTLNGTQAAALL